MYPLSCKSKIFADDIKLYLAFDSHSPTSEDFSALQGDVNQLVKISAALGLRMNPHKCVVLRIVKFVTCHSDLGLCIDRSLKFHEHIRRNVACVGNLTTNLLSCTICRDPDFVVHIYTTQVRPK